jgi:hypothetical protein
MNSPLRLLRALAGILAAAIVVLFVLWVRRDTALPPPVPEPASVRTIDVDPAAPAAPTSAAANPTHTGAIDSTPSAGTTGPDARAADAADAALFGTVRRADGTIVKQGHIWLQRDGNPVGSATVRDGAFAIAGLQPGTHRLTSRIPDELALDREIEVHAPHTRLDLELTSRWVLQVEAVTPDGGPLATTGGDRRAFSLMRHLRAAAFATPLPVDFASNNAATGLGEARGNEPFGDRGQKALPKEVVSVLTLPSDQPVHVALLLGGAMLAQQPVAPQQETVRFVVAIDAVLAKTGKVRFRCVDADGAPVANATVWVSSGNGSGGGNKTDADGHFAAVDLLPGKVSLSVHKEGQQLPPFELLLSAGADVDLGTIAMQRTVKLEFSTAELGKGGQVRLNWLDMPAGSGWQPREFSHRGDSGALQTVSLFPGRYAVVARGEGGVAVQTIDTRALPPSPLHFALQRGAQLTIESRLGAGSARCTIATASGITVYRGELGSRRTPSFELPPGDYVATVDAGSGVVTTKPFTLPPSGTTIDLP